MMDFRQLGVVFALISISLVMRPSSALADGAGKSRGDAKAAGAGRGIAARGDGKARGKAPRRGTAVKRAPATARRGVSDPQVRGSTPVVAVAAPEPPETGPRDTSEPEGAPARSTPGVSSESSSIQPLQPSGPPQASKTAPRGGLRLEVGPPTAQVYVDGFYVGTVDEVNRTQTGLSLPAGWHRIELRAPGYVTPAINVTIEANRTTSYRGELRPLQP